MSSIEAALYRVATSDNERDRCELSKRACMALLDELRDLRQRLAQVAQLQMEAQERTLPPPYLSQNDVDSMEYLKEQRQADKDFADRGSNLPRIEKGLFDRWYLFHPARGRMAWSGSRWVPCTDAGCPTGGAQVCNFPTFEEAVDYVKQHFPEPESPRSI